MVAFCGGCTTPRCVESVGALVLPKTRPLPPLWARQRSRTPQSHVRVSQRFRRFGICAARLRVPQNHSRAPIVDAELIRKRNAGLRIGTWLLAVFDVREPET